MRTIYIDSEYRCRAAKPDETFTEVETSVFDGKCTEYIEGYRFVPAGESWTRADGVVFVGEMVAPWKEHSILDAAQREYEREELADMKEALALLGVTMDE